MKQLSLLVRQAIKAKLVLLKTVHVFLTDKFIPRKKHTQNQTRVALCYLGRTKNQYHTNASQQAILVRLLRELGCEVHLFGNGELVDSPANYYKYVIGFGESWRKLCNKNLEALRILYATEAPPFLSFINESKAIERSKRLGFSVQRPCRSYRFYRDEDYISADYIIQMGAKNCQLLKCTKIVKESALFEIGSYGLGRNKTRKKQSKTNTFLWFGSRGVIHKGLDLLLAYFANHKNLNLIIAGCEKKELISLGPLPGNAKYVGIVDVQSAKFDSVIEESSFCILPSASEGLSTAVITCMYQGLIPIVSHATNIDGPAIIRIELELESIDSAISSAISLTELDYLRKSESIRNFALEKYSEIQYMEDLKIAITNIGIY